MVDGPLRGWDWLREAGDNTNRMENRKNQAATEVLQSEMNRRVHEERRASDHQGYAVTEVKGGTRV